MNFVTKNVPATEDDQRRRVFQIWNSYFESINRRVRADLVGEAKKKSLSQADASAIFQRVLKREVLALRAMRDLNQYLAITHATVVGKYEKEFRAASNAKFRGRRFTPATTKLLKECAGLLITKDAFRFSTSGVVIAGFGKNDLFPGIYRSMWSGIILDQLRIREDP